MPAATRNGRVISIDILRGIVMVLMALDHARDYFSDYRFNPTDLDHADTGMFLTRWITHFCAPVFVFLSGASAFLNAQKKTKGEMARFLLTRGIWLIVLELTIIRFGWVFNLDYSQIMLQVIWVIGWSMVFLAGLIYLPRTAIFFVSMLLILGHNALDTTAGTGAGSMWWHIVHQPGSVPFTGQYSLYVLYPLVPWIGVMGAGYCFGSLLLMCDRARNKNLYAIGIGAMVLFVVIRLFNNYGDPQPWAVMANPVHTVLSFVNCEKYPPSFLYLLMTLGPAILLMPALEQMKNSVGRFFTVYGRVPMFYYILHIYLLHGLALVTALIQGLPMHYFTDNAYTFGAKPGWGYSLPGVYLWWILAVALLYIPCFWFMQIKMHYRSRWLSYL